MVDRGDYYEPEAIISLQFQYSIRNGRALDEQINHNINKPQYPKHRLPITMDPLNYGKLMKKLEIFSLCKLIKKYCYFNTKR